MRAAAKAALAAAAALLFCVLVRGAIGPAQAAPAASAGAARPPISRWAIPFGAKRKAEMAAYSERHYGEREWRLRNPRVIVEHIAVTGSAAGVYSTFASDTPDVELGELPNVCCRHTVGLNWTAIGIEHVGYGDSDLLGDPRELHASLRLTQYLRCHFGIAVHNVIGHAESLSSPYHRELVPSLRTQTHGDMVHASMRVYRRRLRRLGPC
jgi:hypothetical protein